VFYLFIVNIFFIKKEPKSIEEILPNDIPHISLTLEITLWDNKNKMQNYILERTQGKK
jgi:hypothetical protein